MVFHTKNTRKRAVRAVGARSQDLVPNIINRLNLCMSVCLCVYTFRGFTFFLDKNWSLIILMPKKWAKIPLFGPKMGFLDKKWILIIFGPKKILKIFLEIFFPDYF